MTLVVNLYGGPGTGKSTTAALTFGKLKERGVNAELVTEFAKDVVWEDRRVIACQPYVFGKQLWRLQRLHTKVDVIITDSPLPLSLVYAEHMGYHWHAVVLEQHAQMDNLDIFLRRNNTIHPYNPEGRYQKDVQEAEVLDNAIYNLLLDNQLAFTVVDVAGASDAIVPLVLERLLGVKTDASTL